MCVFCVVFFLFDFFFCFFFFGGGGWNLDINLFYRGWSNCFLRVSVSVSLAGSGPQDPHPTSGSAHVIVLSRIILVDR